jgi:hypothetical protein
MRYLLLITYIIGFALLNTWLDYEYSAAIIGSAIRGIGATRDARKLQRKADALNPIRPELQRPEEYKRYLESAQAGTTGDMPGFGRAINQAYGTTANTVDMARSAADSGTGLLQAIAQGDTNQRRQTGDINVQNQGFRQQNMGAFQQALMNMGDQSITEFDVNQMQPYLQEESDKRQFQQAAMEQKQAGREGWASFFDGVTDVAMTALGAPVGTSGQSTFAKLFGGNQTPRTPETAVTPPQRGMPTFNFNMPTPGISR